MGRNNITGAWGEALAADYLRKKRYKLLATRYSCRFGEIDIIAWQEKVLHFIEVKNRTRDLIPGRFAVNSSKQRHIRRSAQNYLQENQLTNNCLVSFDVIEITDGEIEFLENCFY